MKLLITPKPMFNNKMAVVSYCFRFQKSDAMLNLQSATFLDGAMRSPCLEVLSKVGLDTFTCGLPIFAPVNQFSLLTDIENHLLKDADKVIFLLDQTIPPEEAFINSMRKLKAYGYRFAMEKITDYNYMHPLIELSDFLFVNASAPNFKDAMSILRKYYRRLSFVATEVNSLELFEKIKHERFYCFEGRFYNLPITKGNHEISPVKANYIKLLNAVRDEDFSMDEVAAIVSQDTSLSISLFKLVNSPYLGLAQEIKTIKHGVAMLGQKEIRKWVATAVTGLLSSDKPDEITRLSLIRAKFAENLAKNFKMAMHAQSLFLMGLFSILDVVLDMPIANALKVIPVSDQISTALTEGSGDFAKVLEFIRTYETANWMEVSRLMIINSIEGEDVFNAYMDAILWYSSVVSSD